MCNTEKKLALDWAFDFILKEHTYKTTGYTCTTTLQHLDTLLYIIRIISKVCGNNNSNIKKYVVLIIVMDFLLSLVFGNSCNIFSVT